MYFSAALEPGESAAVVESARDGSPHADTPGLQHSPRGSA